VSPKSSQAAPPKETSPAVQEVVADGATQDHTTPDLLRPAQFTGATPTNSTSSFESRSNTGLELLLLPARAGGWDSTALDHVAEQGSGSSEQTTAANDLFWIEMADALEAMDS
jgi:hypothetical protein